MRSKTRYCLPSFLLIVTLASLCVAPPTVARAQPGVQLQAIAGEPFGVGRISLDPGQAAANPSDDVEGFRFYEKSGRIHYPAFGRDPVRGLLRNVLNLPPGSSGYFLFTGTEPLEIVAPDARLRQPLVVRPERAANRHRELLQNWWKQYSERGLLQGLFPDGETPPQVKNYLTHMLAVRMGLPAPQQREGLFASSNLDDALGLMLGAEAMRLQMQRDTLLRRNAAPPAANLPLPAPFVLPSSPVAEAPATVAIEPLAQHVPQDCFYLRCGSYANFQWLRNFLSQAGGDLQSLITHRGVSYGVNARLERQLILKSSALADLLGDLVISDVALIGADTFLRDGAAMGVLFEARNNTLLSSNIAQQRQAALKLEPLAKEQQVEIAGHKVSFISTPDNTVRTYYAVDGGYHFITTSRALVERFYAAGQGERSLAALPEFRQTRVQFPVERQDTVFLYLSTPFLGQLTTPQYRVEMNRRLQASGDIELVYLAQLAARGEGQPADTLAQLVAGQFLPPGFGQRADGSHIVLENSVAYDSLRGGRGSFTPIPDLPPTSATAAEIDDYRRLAEYSQSKVQWLDPLIAGIMRQSMPGGQNERVTIDLSLTPFADSQIAFLTDWLAGPADAKRLAPMQGDLITAEVNLAGQHLFAGLRDCNPLRLLVDSKRDPAGALLQTLTAPPLDDVLGYVGATSAGSLGFLGDIQFSPPDAQGFARSGGPVWRREYGDYVVLSFHKSVLETVPPLLRFEAAARPATARLRAGDLRSSQLAGMLDTWGGNSAQDISRGNTRLLNSLVQQMHLPPTECLAAAEQILDAQLICPLGGEYVLANADVPQAALWTSTALSKPRSADSGRAPGGYQFPLLNWFRGLDSDFLLAGKSVRAHLEIDMAPINGRANGKPSGNGPKPSTIKPVEELPTPKPAK